MIPALLSRSRKRTAFIVIHGIGEQLPFETLDAFTASFIRPFGEVKLAHAITTRSGASGNAWQENFIQVERTNGYPIDIHEFYWAYMTEEKITIPETVKWVEQTLAATKKYYKENKELQTKYEARRGTKRFPLARVLLLLRFAAFMLPFVKLFGVLFSPISKLPFFTWITKLFRAAINKFGWIVTGYLGDVAIYTTTDEKSKYYRIRQQILNESQTLVEAVLDDDAYDRVIIAGHSLGSVIAYDTLDRINIKANLPEGKKLPIQKLAGLITFGSPLDKIAFFFRERTRPGEYIRRKILAHLHSFKAKPLSPDEGGQKVSDPIKPKLEKMPWVNYYANNDPVSGHLDFYNIFEQDNMSLSQK
ncbi:MAG: hypothetical protein ABR936_16835 [Bacteroidota bacterium]|jgi:hypothetical protein